MADDPERRGAPNDAYEAIDMHDGSQVVHRDKVVSRFMTGILLLSAIVPATLAIVLPFLNASSDRPVPGAVLPFVIGGLALMALFFVVLSIAFGVLRTVVTERAVHIKYGLWGPTIELSSIRAARVTPYQVMKYGGWGIRHGIDGSWAYVGPNPGDVVEIEYLDGGGATRKVVVGPENATALVAAIERARGRQGPRVAEMTAAAQDAREHADADIEALAAAEADEALRGATPPARSST